MALFHNGNTEGILLLVHNFNMTLTASGMLETADKAKYFCTLFYVEALRQFDLMSSDMESKNPLKAEDISLGLGTYFLPVNSISNKKCSPMY